VPAVPGEGVVEHECSALDELCAVGAVASKLVSLNERTVGEDGEQSSPGVVKNPVADDLDLSRADHGDTGSIVVDRAVLDAVSAAASRWKRADPGPVRGDLEIGGEGARTLPGECNTDPEPLDRAVFDRDPRSGYAHAFANTAPDDLVTAEIQCHLRR
jgi:hypothetical protein